MIDDVEAFNDRLAREHDIDDYYARSHVAIRLIEKRRLDHIERLVAARPHDRILEVGCGGGHVLQRFPHADLTGVDVSSVMLDKARENLVGYRVTLHRGELDAIDLEARSFDAIICSEVLEHVADPDRVLTAMQRLVRQDGRVVVTFPNDRLIHRLKRLASPFIRRVDWGGDEHHLHQWTIHEMRLTLSCYFSVVEERFAPSRFMPIRCCFGCRLR